jgi:hypothetical protein
MFNLFKSDKEDRPADVKSIRYELLQFVKQELQKAEGGEGGNIKGLNLYINCLASEKAMYEAPFTPKNLKFLKTKCSALPMIMRLTCPKRG